MIHTDFTEKALVPYEPPAISKAAVGGSFFDRLFDARKGNYFVFLGLFFLSSAFARCVSAFNPGVAASLHADAKAAAVSGVSPLLLRFLLQHAALILTTFLSGFTPFALPVALFSAVHNFFGISFFYFAVTADIIFDLYVGLSVLLSLSLIAASGILFYTEVLFLSRGKGIFHCLIYTLLFLLYPSVIFFVLRYILTII